MAKNSKGKDTGELVTIVLNVYNCEKYVKKCLDSLIKQTYKNLEILIINDGSTDKSLEICEKYQKKDNRIRIITHENCGLSLSRNAGIDNAKGEYIYFIDSDDYIEKDTIEYLYNLCKKYDSKISTCDPIDIYDYNVKVKNKKEKIEIVSSIDYVKMILLSVKRTGTVWNKLIKKELFNNLRFEKRGVNDVVLVYKLVLKTDSICCSNQIKYYYLRNDESITMRKRTSERTIDFYKASVERYDYLEKRYPNMIENKVCLNQITINSYLHKDDEVWDYLNKAKAIDLYNKLFSIKMMGCKIGFREKIKLILFRINPKMFFFIMDKYLGLKKCKR